MSIARKAVLAAGTMLIAAGFAASAPVAAQEADDFMRLQESLNGTASETADAADAEPAAETSRADSEEGIPVVIMQPSGETSALDDGELSQSFLSTVSKRQREVALKKLELEALRLQSEIDKLSGAAAAREAAINASIHGSSPSSYTEPQDDPSTLPGVAAIIGAQGHKMVELTLAGGGTLTARPGDTLPGGWTLARIDGSAVYVKSVRTGNEYILGSDSEADSAAQATWQPAPAATDGPVYKEEAGGAPIILAPAE